MAKWDWNIFVNVGKFRAASLDLEKYRGEVDCISDFL